MNNLTCNCVPRLDGVSAAELGRLSPEPSITAPLLSLLQESGIDGFNLRSIVVLKDVNEGLQASMVFVDDMAALRYSAVTGVFAAVVFILGIMAAKLEERRVTCPKYQVMLLTKYTLVGFTESYFGEVKE